MSEPVRQKKAWGNKNNVPVTPFSFKDLMHADEEKKLDDEMNSMVVYFFCYNRNFYRRNDVRYSFIA